MGPASQWQLRAIKDASESRHQRRVEGEHQVVPWMVMHAASVINVWRQENEVFSAYRGWRCTEFTRPVAKIGERAWFAPAMSAGKDKSDVR